MSSTVAANVLEHGTGALNVDACRVGVSEGDDVLRQRAASVVGDTPAPFGKGMAMAGRVNPSGRWPANVVLDESQAAELDRQSGNVKSGGNSKKHKRTSPNWGGYSGGSGIVSGAEQPPSEGGRVSVLLRGESPEVGAARRGRYRT